MSRNTKKQPLCANSSKLNSIISASFAKKAQKSMVSPVSAEIIQLSQPEITFINTEANEVYEISISVRNVGQKSTSLKIRKPKSDFLQVRFDKDGNLAPGLQKKIIATFNSQANEQIIDKMFLYSEDEFDIEVPVCVYPNAHHLIYDPFVNLGFLKIGSTKEHIVKIENKGSNIAEIKLEVHMKEAKAIIEPTFLTIQPKSEQYATLSVSSEEKCEFEGFIQISPQFLGQSNIEIMGSFCDQSRFIADDEGKQISELQLSPLFGGQKKVASFNLVNNTPKPCQYRIIRKKGTNYEDQTTLMTPQQFGRNDEQKNITFSTIEGSIDAYSKKQVICDIIAKLDEHDQHLFCNYVSGRIKLLPHQSREWAYFLSINFKDEETAKNLLIKGESMIPKLCISSTFFKFGDCNMRTKMQKILKIQNLSDKSVQITLQKSQNYSFLPEVLEIPKDGFKEVIVKFFPKVIGELSEICNLRVGSFHFPIKMFGKGIFVKDSHLKSSTVKENKKYLDNSRGEQISIGDLNNTQLEHEISAINEKSYFIEENSKICTTNFDSSSILTKNKSEQKNQIKKKTLKNKNGKEIVVDVLNFNPDEEVAEYPCGKTTQEDRVVSRQLTLNEFTNIPVGPVILDFGQIFVSSAQKKTFHICNLNSKPISIQIDTKGNQQFEKTSKQMQILPPESHGGLKVIYQTMQEGPFKHNVLYVINGRHYFQILVVGSAILPTILPSKTEFKFVAGEDDHTFEKKETMILSNLYPYEVDYSFLLEKQSLFKISPSKGTIEANGKQTITIVHNFLGMAEGGSRIDENIKLKIRNGKTMDLKLTSIVPDCHIICKPNQCNFKEISICRQHEMKFSIKNVSKNFTIFKIIPNKDIEEEVKITATKTTLATEEISEVTVKMLSQKEQVIQSGLTIIVRGGRKIFVPIRANVIVPKIKLQGEDINFGTMPVGGNPTPKQVTLINDSSVPADLQLVLPIESFLNRCLSIKTQSNQFRTVLPAKQVKQRKARVFQIRIMKKCKVQICLQFQPEQVKDYKFSLPLYLAGTYEPNPQLQKNIVCRSLKNRLISDYKEIDFGKTIIEQSLQNFSKSITFTLHNPQEDCIEWWVNEKSLDPFTLEIKKGVIVGNSQMKIKVFFYSENPGSFEKELQLYVNNSDFEPSRPYIKIPIKATAIYPQIYFDRPYLILPTVRLNQESIGKFQILNGGYENLNLKHSISEQYSNININLKYMNGCNLGVTKKSITVLVSFKSDRPVSFTMKIEFYDHHNRIFNIYVSGTADNSLYVLPDDSWLPNPLEEIQKSASFLATFLNSLGFVEDILGNFPQCLCENDYENLHRLLQYFSSSQTQKLQKLRPLSKKSNTVLQNYQYLSQAIKILKSQGAFLNSIRPQYLMNENDYLQIITTKCQNQRIFQNYKMPTSEQIKQRTIKSWITLVYQIFKIYSKVPIKKKSVSGDIWTQMSLREKTIINWIQQCYQSQAQLMECKSSNQLRDLGNGEMLSSLISKYTNIKILDSYGKTISSQKEKEKRCKKIIEVFSQIGITAGARAEDLLRSKPFEMLIFLQRLYMLLPYYLQKGDPIIFSCSMGQSLTKSVQIKNPSKYPVTYTAKIQGSKAYIIENQQQFEIESKQKHQVQVKYISNIDMQKTNASLTLTGKTSGKYTPSTFIFPLKSISLGRISQKNIQITGQLYQPYQFTLNVKNNFANQATFIIQITPVNTKIQYKNIFCLNPIVKIKKDQTVTVAFVFFPIVLETHKYQVLFRDQKVGEFQYDITGLVDMPQVMSEEIRFSQTFYTNKSYTAQIAIPNKNQQILRARKQIDGLLQKFNRRHHSHQGSGLLQGKKQPPQPVERNNYPSIKGDTYSLSLMPQNDMVVLKTTSIVMDFQGNDEANGLIKKVSFDVNIKMPIKDAPLYLVMRNSSGSDIRIYKLLVNCVYKPLRYEMQIKIPVNESLNQPLPLINVSNQPNFFTVTFTPNDQTSGRNVFSFTNQKDLMVKQKQQSTVTLTFSPKTQQTYTGILKIQNTTIGQIIEYQIQGIGEQPDAQSIKFQQKTNETKKHEIKIPYSRPQKFTVTKCTFSNKNIKFQKYHQFLSDATSVFKFQFVSKIPGIHEGKIYLQDQSKTYAYNVVINVNQNIEGVVEIKAIQRARKQVFVNLDQGNWVVENFDPCLIIPENVVMNQPGEFGFWYVGSKPGQRESELVFKSQVHGHVKYLLKISIEEQPEMEIHGLKAQLGKTQSMIVRLENPDSSPAKVTGICTNQPIFYYQPEGSFTIPGKSTKQLKIFFKPSCLQLETGKISLSSNNNLKWKYDLNGQGTLQTSEQVREINAQIGQEIVELVRFSNPFKNGICVYVFLENQKEPDGLPFHLITKSNKFSLQYQEEMEIPIKFTCTQARRYCCKIKVLINEKIFWRYWINVRTIYRSEEEPKILKLSSRQKKQIAVSFNLPNLTQQNNTPIPAQSPEQISSQNQSPTTTPSIQGSGKQLSCSQTKFKCILTAQDPSLQPLLRSTCRILKDWQSIINGKLVFFVNLLSYKPFSCPFFFEIYQENNCKWVFKGEVEFTVPPADDQFEIVTEVNRSTSVMFRLNNRVKSHAKFKAYFSSDSNMEFSVSPKTGDLEPYGRQGSQFEVTFAPTQYKNCWHGKLIIETEDSFWSYIVKGSLPHYLPPVGKSSISSLSRKIQ